jgi:G:T-mismatch repair DNA endonuclease (very short patch repair protein)
MSQIAQEDTDFERKPGAIHYDRGLRGYRLNVKFLPGKPDIVFSGWFEKITDKQMILEAE